MKRIQHTLPKMKGLTIFLFALLMIAQLTSCSSARQTNFGKKKYTNFRTAKVKKIKGTPSESSYEEDFTVIESPEKTTLDQKTEDLPIISLADVISDKSNMSSEAIEIVEEKIEYDKTEETTKASENNSSKNVGNRTDFEKLDKKEQMQRLIDYNSIFNATAVIMIIAGLALMLGAVAVYMLFVAGGFAIIGWVLSMVALTKVKRVKVKSQTKAFVNKFIWLKVLNVIGILVCVVTILPGLILLLVWALRGI